MYEEIETAIKGVLEEVDESDSFKRRFEKLIPSFFETSYSTPDLEETIDLMKVELNEEEDI